MTDVPSALGDASRLPDVVPSQTQPTRHGSYSQILRSTALIGGSSVINVGFSILRSKLLAMLLGPAGVGVFGLYASVLDLAQSLAGLGLQSSGVREIAAAKGAGDTRQIARVVTALRWASLGLGTLGALALAALAMPLARLTFGDEQRATGVALLGIAVFFFIISSGQTAVVHGLRRIGDLARLSVLGAFFSTVVTVPLVYVYREDGIVPSLVIMAGVSTLTSWWYSRKTGIRAVHLTLPQFRQETEKLLRLGLVFMASGFLTVGSAYLIRILVLHHEGLEAAGLYQAAWALGGFYAGFILQAMGADFYPRLTAVRTDNAECNRLINEQAEISMLLAGPGVLATLTFASLIMTIFYAPPFQPAATLLRWISLGMTLRIISWPIGYIVLAKGVPRVFFWTEVLASIVQVGLAAILIPLVGLNGAGQAFLGLYVVHTAVVYAIARRLSGFRLSPVNRRLGIIMLSSAGLVFGSVFLLPPAAAMAFGLVAVVLSTLSSARHLLVLGSPEALPPKLRALRNRLVSR